MVDRHSRVALVGHEFRLLLSHVVWFARVLPPDPTESSQLPQDSFPS